MDEKGQTSPKKQKTSSNNENEASDGSYYYSSSEMSYSDRFSDITDNDSFEEDFVPSDSEEEIEESQGSAVPPSQPRSGSPESKYSSSSGGRSSSEEFSGFSDDSSEDDTSDSKEDTEESAAVPPLQSSSKASRNSPPPKIRKKSFISSLSTTGELKKIDFIKQNEFFGNPEPTPAAYFNFFVEDEFLAMICAKTNANAESVMTTQKLAVWEELKIPELRVFLGLLFHMGTVRGTPIHEYWKSENVFINMPIFRRNMKRDRFLMIIRFLYFSSLTENDDPLHKVRSLMDYFTNKMNSCYYPGKNLLLYSIVLWKGMWHYEIKEEQNGIKIDMLTEPSGLILKFDVAKSQDTVGRKKIERVMQLLKEKLQNGHSVYTDMDYSSFGLAKRLLENNTYCTGILSKDKSILKNLFKKVMAKEENISRYRHGVHIGKFKDVSTVMYITTEFEDKLVTLTSKRGKISKVPEAIAKYNEIVCVKNEELLEYYPCDGKVFRWYLKLAIHTFQMLLFNSYVMYTKYSKQAKMEFGDYRMAVIENMMSPAASEVENAPRDQELQIPCQEFAKREVDPKR